MKLCSQCGQTKPFDAFGKNRTAPDKLAYWCKECWSLENLQPLWQEENLRKGAKIMHGSQNS